MHKILPFCPSLMITLSWFTRQLTLLINLLISLSSLIFDMKNWHFNLARFFFKFGLKYNLTYDHRWYGNKDSSTSSFIRTRWDNSGPTASAMRLTPCRSLPPSFGNLTTCSKSKAFSKSKIGETGGESISSS
jgi:hypothetical protein